MVQLHGRGTEPILGAGSCWLAECGHAPSSRHRAPSGERAGPAGQLGGQWARCPGRGLPYPCPCPGRACPPCPPSPTCCWRTRRWRPSSCHAHSLPHSAAPSRSGRLAPRARAPGPAPPRSLLPRWQGLAPGRPHRPPAPPLPPRLPPVQAQAPRRWLGETTEEITVRTGISRQCQAKGSERENRREAGRIWKWPWVIQSNTTGKGMAAGIWK